MNDSTELINEPSAESTESVEDRIRRLEQALAAVQDTRLMEERVLEKISHRIDQKTPSVAGLIPGVLNAVTHPHATSGGLFSARSWLLTDLIQELRTFAMLYFDFRYKPTLIAKILPPVCLVLGILSWLLIRGTSLGFGIPVLGGPLDYLVDAVLVMIVYKTLQRESARYRAQISL